MSFLFLSLIGSNACRSCLLARDARLAACFLGGGFFHDLLLLGSLLGGFLFCQLGLAACLPLGDLLHGPALTLCHFLLARRMRFARFFNRLVFGGGCGLCGLLCRFILLISGSRLWLLCLVSAAGAGCGSTGFSGSAVIFGSAAFAGA